MLRLCLDWGRIATRATHFSKGIQCWLLMRRELIGLVYSIKHWRHSLEEAEVCGRNGSKESLLHATPFESVLLGKIRAKLEALRTYNSMLDIQASLFIVHLSLSTCFYVVG